MMCSYMFRSWGGDYSLIVLACVIARSKGYFIFPYSLHSFVFMYKYIIALGCFKFQLCLVVELCAYTFASIGSVLKFLPHRPQGGTIVVITWIVVSWCVSSIVVELCCCSFLAHRIPRGMESSIFLVFASLMVLRAAAAATAAACSELPAAAERPRLCSRFLVPGPAAAGTAGLPPLGPASVVRPGDLAGPSFSHSLIPVL